ncbi:hypothetical protein BP5796_09423 [Coleophoma crateriformis]|uniref:DUF8032 domain-containing protein n=1 Tax=Coleophoma crateriformis TaxID=565419 RepID=A0A3D8QYN8_9HELO|nr:hypothetical protein BP5796_09423 [Coleophoma crateriformis]
MQHHPHHPQQGPPPPQHLQHPRPSSIVHQQHHQQAPPPQQSQHSNPYPPAHGLPQYAQPPPGSGGQHPQELPYYTAHPSPYSTPSATGTYSSAGETPDIMAAAQMTRPYPPISYHTPQSNSPASVASPQAHEQHRMYGAPTSQLQQNPQMYYAQPQQQQYPPPMTQNGPSPYAPHPQHQQHQQSMTSQPNLLMSNQHPGQHAMQQHPAAQHQQQQQQAMTGSPRPKMEPHVPQLTRPSQPLGTPQHQNTTPQQNLNNVPGSNNGGSGVNPNAAPGPIPATTPLVVRQDNNGVQWIAFEYSRDRVKMEYTIRCDVESVNVETLSPEFKTENCVYPRACCNKDQYRGNRLVYESECNTVGWALAELNPCLRGKRGLIQRAVDSWRNSNQDPRLRSRRVRRMAKISNRKAVQAATSHNPHMPGSSGPAGMPASGSMGPGGTPNMGKPSLGGMGGPQLHHHHQSHGDGSAQGGEEVDNDDYQNDEQHHHHHQAPAETTGDVRQTQVFPGYTGNYPPNPSVGGAAMAPSLHDPSRSHQSNPVTARAAKDEEEDRLALFGDIPEAKKRKFILVDDPGKGGRVRVRVTLDTIDIKEIPDSFRKSNSVYPRSWFPMQMQSPPPSAHGSRFFESDDADDDDVSAGARSRRGRTMVNVPLADGGEAEVACPRMRKSIRSKEVKLNDLGFRLTWHQSRVFADKTVFLQKALDSYRNKVRSTMETIGKDIATAPHFETRVGKRKWTERTKRIKGGDTDA